MPQSPTETPVTPTHQLLPKPGAAVAPSSSGPRALAAAIPRGGRASPTAALLCSQGWAHLQLRLFGSGPHRYFFLLCRGQIALRLPCVSGPQVPLGSSFSQEKPPLRALLQLAPGKALCLLALLQEGGSDLFQGTVRDTAALAWGPGAARSPTASPATVYPHGLTRGQTFPQAHGEMSLRLCPVPCFALHSRGPTSLSPNLLCLGVTHSTAPCDRATA